jgi:hypothetical protein
LAAIGWQHKQLSVHVVAIVLENVFHVKHDFIVKWSGCDFSLVPRYKLAQCEKLR